jgi:glycosyltransferase involved in cell wall biosynthesis
MVPGCVPSLTPYLNRAAVVVVPIRSGGGMRVKVLEALSAGKAVVASSRAVEGLDIVSGEHALLAESDEDFVRQVLWLLRHPEERGALARRARAWSVANLGWDRAASQYAALYDDLLRRRSLMAAGRHNG